MKSHEASPSCGGAQFFSFDLGVNVTSQMVALQNRDVKLTLQNSVSIRPLLNLCGLQ